MNRSTKTTAIRVLSALALLVFSATSAIAQGSCDFDADGRSDLISVTASDSGISFSALLSASTTGSALGTLGSSLSTPFVSNFLGAATPQIGTLLGNSTTGLIDWSILDSTAQSYTASLGNSGDSVIIGADVNGDGATDALTVGINNLRLNWQIDTALFNGNGTTLRQLRWGGKSELPFYLSLDGTRDVLGVVRRFSNRFVIRTYDLVTGATSRVQGDGSLGITRPRQRPLPLKLADGTDILVVSEVVNGATDLVLFNLVSRAVTTKSIAATGTVLIGDYTADAGEEVAVQSETGLIIYNPNTDTTIEQPISAGSYIDGIEASKIMAATPTPVPGLPAGPGLDAVCASRSTLATGEFLIKSEISNHIGNKADPRTTGYTLVCAKQCPKNQSKVDFFYSDGTYAGSVGYYGRYHGNGKPRLYGAAGKAPQHFVSLIAPAAASIGNGKLYMQTSKATTGASTTCKEFNPTGRNGGL